MKKDVNGCSTCLPGQEQYETFRHYNSKTKQQEELFQYGYRVESGELFTCVSTSLVSCQIKRNHWLIRLLHSNNPYGGKEELRTELEGFNDLNLKEQNTYLEELSLLANYYHWDAHHMPKGRFFGVMEEN